MDASGGRQLVPKGNRLRVLRDHLRVLREKPHNTNLFNPSFNNLTLKLINKPVLAPVNFM